MSQVQVTAIQLRRRLWWVTIPLWAYAALISIFSAIPTAPPGPPWIPYFDKLEHIVEYGILGVLAGRFALTSPGIVWRKLAWWLFPIVISAYGCVDELHQSFVPGRVCSLGDWVADSIGGILGTACMLLWGKSHLNPKTYR